MLQPYKPQHVRMGGGLSSAPGSFSVVRRQGTEPIGGAHFIGFDQDAGGALYDVRCGGQPQTYILTTDGRFEPVQASQ